MKKIDLINLVKFKIVTVLIFLVSCTIEDIANNFDVTFIGETFYRKTVTYKEGDLITPPDNIVDHPCSMEHEEFTSIEGWYINSDFTGESYDFKTQTISNSFTLYAKWNGSRGADKPYQICDWKQLQWIAGGDAGTKERERRLSSSYILLNDITFPEPGQDDFPEYGFVPIGYDTGNNEGFDGMAFTGSFDGSNHIISNFFINTKHSDWETPNGVFPNQTLDNDFIGLFGQIDKDAVVKNLTIVLRPTNNAPTSINNAPTSIKSVGQFIGGVVGNLKSGSLSNVSVQGGMIYGGFHVGGIVGIVGSLTNRTNAKVSGYATGDITVENSHAGGLVGENHGTVIGYATGNVLGTGPGGGNIGGLIGENSGSVIGYATGNVTAINGNGIGGLVGNSGNTVIGYATGKVLGDQSVGGLVPGDNPDNTIGYWDVSSTGQSNPTTQNNTNNTNYYGISATKNIVYDNNSNEYKDTQGTTDDTSDDKFVFNISSFTEHFTLPGESMTWPKLKDKIFSLLQPTVSDENSDQKIDINWND